MVTVACGRYGFDDRTRTPAPDGDDGVTITSDGAPGADGALADAPGAAPDAPAAACGWLASCGTFEVTCCDAAGVAACITTTAACATPHRYECDATTGEGCTITGEMCCLTIDAQGTECVNPTTEPCYG